MPWKPSRHQLNALTEMRASYRFKIRKEGTVPNEKSAVVCTIHDAVLGKDFAKGEGIDERLAFQAAMQDAAGAEKPKTPGELRSEVKTLTNRTKELEAELAKLRGEQGDVKAPPAPEPPPEPEAEPTEPEQIPLASSFERRDEIRAFLQSRDIEHDGRAGKEELLALAIRAGVVLEG